MSSKKLTDPERVADRLHSAAIHLLRRLRRTDVESGLGPARLSVLSILVYAGNRTVGELARMEQVRAPTMTRLIQALEADGLVTRRTHKRDRRALTIKATAKGHRTLINAQKRRIHGLAVLMRDMAPEDLRTLALASQLMEGLAATGSA